MTTQVQFNSSDNVRFLSLRVKGQKLFAYVKTHRDLKLVWRDTYEADATGEFGPPDYLAMDVLLELEGREMRVADSRLIEKVELAIRFLQSMAE